MSSAFLPFCIVGGVPLEDPVGLECKSDADAKIKMAFARQIAIDLDGDNEDRRVIAFDERGSKVTIPLRSLRPVT